MFKSCQHRYHVQQQKTTQTMFAPLAFYYIKITVSQKKLRVTLIQISTHLYSPLLQKERQNVEKGPRKSNTWKLNTWYVSWRNNPFLWRASAVQYVSQKLEFPAINQFNKKKPWQPSFKCCTWFGCISVSGSFDQSWKKSDWLDLLYWKWKMNWEAHLFYLEKETKTDKLTKKPNQATGQTNYLCLANHFSPHLFL